MSMIRKDILIRVNGDASNADRQLKMIERDVRRITDSIMTSERVQARFGAKFTKFKREMTTFTGVGSMKVPGMGILGGAMGMLGVGVGLAEAITQVTDLETAVTEYRKTTGLSLEETLKYKQSVLDLGIRSGVATDKILDLNQAMFNASKNSKFVADNMEFLTHAFQAVGGDANEFGGFMGKLNREWGLSGKNLQQFVGGLYAIGKSTGTQMNLKEITGQAAELAETVKTFYGEHASPELLKKYMVAAMVVGPQAMQMAIRRLSTPNSVRFLNSAGVKVYSKGAERSITDILADLKKNVPPEKFGQMLSRIFGGKAGLEPMLKLSEHLDDINSKIDDTGELTKDAALETESLNAAWQTVRNAFLSIAASALGPALSDIAMQIKSMDPNDIKNIGEVFSGVFKTLALGAKVVSALADAWKDLAEGTANAIYGTADKGPVDVNKAIDAYRGVHPLQLGRSPAQAAKEAINTHVQVYIDGQQAAPARTVTKVNRGAQFVNSPVSAIKDAALEFAGAPN